MMTSKPKVYELDEKLKEKYHFNDFVAQIK